jgi:hypothetical protein
VLPHGLTRERGRGLRSRGQGRSLRDTHDTAKTGPDPSGEIPLENSWFWTEPTSQMPRKRLTANGSSPNGRRIASSTDSKRLPARFRKKGALGAGATRAKWFLRRTGIVHPCKRFLARSSSVLFGLGWDRRHGTKPRRMTNSRHRKTEPAPRSGRRTIVHKRLLPVRWFSLVTLRLKPRKHDHRN